MKEILIFYIVSSYIICILLYFIVTKLLKKKVWFKLLVKLSPQAKKQIETGMMMLLFLAPLFLPIFIVGFAYNMINNLIKK